MELESYFNGLLQNIEPSPTAVECAQNAHKKLRTILENDEDIAEANPDTFLTGSYARHTAINDIKDVDIILLIEIDKDIDGSTPSNVIGWIHQILQKYYKHTREQGRSVKVTTDSGFDLDIVSATLVSLSDGPVWIPDREAQEWVKTHPKGQIAFGIAKNKATNGYYKKLVKIMKHWKDRISNKIARPNSYIIETLVAESLISIPQSYGQGVVDILESIYTKYSPNLITGKVPVISDPGYPSVNVAKRWEFGEFSAFMQEAKSAWSTASAALNERDINKSVKLWRVLFGEKFERINL